MSIQSAMKKVQAALAELEKEMKRKPSHDHGRLAGRSRIRRQKHSVSIDNMLDAAIEDASAAGRALKYSDYMRPGADPADHKKYLEEYIEALAGNIAIDHEFESPAAYDRACEVIEEVLWHHLKPHAFPENVFPDYMVNVRSATLRKAQRTVEFDIFVSLDEKDPTDIDTVPIRVHYDPNFKEFREDVMEAAAEAGADDFDIVTDIASEDSVLVAWLKASTRETPIMQAFYDYMDLHYDKGRKTWTETDGIANTPYVLDYYESTADLSDAYSEGGMDTSADEAIAMLENSGDNYLTYNVVKNDDVLVIRPA